MVKVNDSLDNRLSDALKQRAEANKRWLCAINWGCHKDVENVQVIYDAACDKVRELETEKKGLKP